MYSKAILFEQENNTFILLSSKVIYRINFSEYNEILEINEEKSITNNNLFDYQYLGYFS